MKHLILSTVAISMLTFGLTGCGGGGDSSSDGTSSLSFPTNAVAAEPTQENGNEVAQSVVVSDPSESLSALPLNSVDSTTQNGAVQISNQTMLQLSDTIKSTIESTPTYALNETVNETFPCSDSGTYSISGTGSDGGDISVTMSYNQCVQDNTTMNGSMKVRLSGFNQDSYEYSSTKVDFTSAFSMTASGIDMSIASGSYMYMTVNTFTDYYPTNYSVDVSYIATMNGLKFGLKDCKFAYTYNPDTYTLVYSQSQGRIYLGTDLSSYVDVNTEYNPAVEYTYEYGTLESGAGHYLMAGGAKLDINATGSGSYEISIDDNGTISTQSYPQGD